MTACCGDLVADSRQRLRIARGQHDVGACGTKAQGQGGADALGGAGDQHGFAGDGLAEGCEVAAADGGEEPRQPGVRPGLGKRVDQGLQSTRLRVGQ